jgi:opacity protein-like surface antigen
MSVRKLVIASALGVIVSIGSPTTASADWLLTPFIGWNWGGTANFSDIPDFEDKFEQRMNFGASFGFMGAGVLGWEVDFAFSPNFFENTVGSGDFGFGSSNVTTLMGNVVLGIPLGGQHGLGFRPFAVGGLGLIKSRIGDAADLFDITTNDFGFNVGAGAMFFFSDSVGVRGDFRFFRSLQDNEPDNEFDVGFADFRFFRGTLGVTIRW